MTGYPQGMHTWQAILYIAAIILLLVAAFLVSPNRWVAAALVGAALALLAYSLPVIAS